MNLIFDFDGTIGDTTGMFYSTLSELIEELGLPPISEEDFERARGMTLREAMSEFKVSKLQLPRLASIAQAKFKPLAITAKPVPGMDAVIPKLAEKHTLGIMTSNSVENVEAFLDANNMRQYFQFVESGSSLFGKHRYIKKLIKEHDFKKEDTYYIGDELRDIDGANKAGVKMIAMTTGFNTKKILSEHNPEYLFDKPEQITELFQNQAK